MNEIITTFITLYGPSIASALSSIVVAVSTIGSVMKYLKANKADKELLEKLDTVIGQNRELKQTNKRLMEKLTHIKED